MNTIAVIPCHNEQKTIESVVRGALSRVDRVVVVNNLSTDKTAEKASLAGAMVLPCLARGAGAATRAGIQYSLQQGADIIVTLDGDGQHDTDDIPVLVKPIKDGAADMVVGSRFLRRGAVAPIYRRAGISIITAAFNVGSRRFVSTDAQCGFRAYLAGILVEIGIDDDGFTYIVETLVKARRAGLRIAEAPVRCIYHPDLASNSTQNPVRQGVTSLLAVARWRLREEWRR